MKKILILLSFFSLILSCKKKDSTPTKTDFLTASAWKVTGERMMVGSGAWVDVHAQASNCDKDNLVYFKTGGVYEEKEGATKCNQSDPDIVSSGTWALMNNETEFYLTINGATPIKAKILRLDGSHFELEVKEQINNQTVTVQVTMGH
jgi:hypothetical protein